MAEYRLGARNSRSRVRTILSERQGGHQESLLIKRFGKIDVVETMSPLKRTGSLLPGAESLEERMREKSVWMTVYG